MQQKDVKYTHSISDLVELLNESYKLVSWAYFLDNPEEMLFCLEKAVDAE